MEHTFKIDGFQCVYDGLISDCSSVSFGQDEKIALVLLNASHGGQVVLRIERTALSSLAQMASMALAQK